MHTDVVERPVSPGVRDTRGTIPLMLAAAFVMILNETILGMALPQMMVSLRIDEVTAQWLSTAFMLTMAVVIPITGFVIERFNTRSIFLASLTLFSVGTLAAALSNSFPILLLARVVQASGTAIMMPLLMTTVLTIVPIRQRGRMMGNISIVMSVAPALGPTLAGVILKVLNWHAIFGLVLPLALVMWVLGFVRLRNVTDPVRLSVDVLSVVLSAFGFGGLVYALSLISTLDNPSAVVTFAASLAVGAIGLVTFVLRQLVLQRRGNPLLDLRTFTIPTFTLSLSAMAISFGSMIGAFILLPLYMQNVMHIPSATAGLLLLPGGLVMGLMGQVVGRLYDRIGPRPLTIPGAAILVVALLAMSRLTPTMPAWSVLAMHVTLSIGLGLMFTPLFSAGLGALPRRLYSHGSALVGTLQQVGGAAGTALLVTLFALGTAQAATGGATESDAMASGFRLALVVAAIIAAAAVVMVAFIGRPADADEPGEHEPDPEPIGLVAELT